MKQQTKGTGRERGDDGDLGLVTYQGTKRMEAARGFGRLSSAAVARASVAWCLGEAASKLGMRSHGRGHPIFMARSSLGRKSEAATMVVTDLVSHR